jgi:peptidoglycan/xylan/chitin deacetylase (PgdA/CDA1 family)
MTRAGRRGRPLFLRAGRPQLLGFLGPVDGVLMTMTPLQVGSIAAGVAGAAGLAAYSMLNARSGLLVPVIWRGDRSGPPRVALTFDDGPGPSGTAQILDVLARLEAPAAFFVIGSNARRSPALVRRMDEEGHVVANHTFDHLRLGILKPRAFWRDQLARTDEIIVDLIGKRPRFFRAPLGFKSWTMRSPLRERGHLAIAWTRRALDGIPTTTPKILRRLRGARAGDILVLHDGEEPDRPRDQSATVAAIEPLVQGLRDRGIEIVRLDALIGREAYSPATVRVGITEEPVAAIRP